MVVGGPGENADRGAFRVIRGSSNGYASTGSSGFARELAGVPGDPVDGERFATSISVARLPGDDRPDVVVTARNAQRLDDAIVLVEGGRGAFAPEETRSTRLRFGDAVQEPQIDAIRIARGPSS